MSPPASLTWCCSAIRRSPRKKARTQDWGNAPGRARERKAATGSPPIAAISLSPLARQRWPTDSGGCQFLRKWIPSKLKSVVTRQSKSEPIRKTAQSSPIPTRIDALARPVSRFLPPGDTRRRSCAIRSLSGSSGIYARAFTANWSTVPKCAGKRIASKPDAPAVPSPRIELARARHC